MGTVNQQPDNAGLTDEELAAMAELDEQMADTDESDPLFDPDAVVKDEGGGKGEGKEPPKHEEEQEEEEEQEPSPEDQAKADQEKADKEAADKAAADETAAAEAAKPKQQAVEPGAPVFVSQMPEDAEAKLADIATRKDAAATKWDDGDLTAKEYQAELEALNKEERKLERAIDRAQLADEMELQRVNNERTAEIKGFLKGVDIPYDVKSLKFRAIDAAVIQVASDPANANLSVTETMQAAYDLCVAEGVLQAKAKPDAAPPAKKGDAAPAAKGKPPIKPPPTLAGLPASETTGTEDNRFAYLNRISNPDQREAAFAKLSAADQEAYLATGG